MKQFQTAFGLYLLWAALAWLSSELGQTVMTLQSSVVLLTGIAATNLLFYLVARSDSLQQPPAATVAAAQCVFAVTWITLYAFLSNGAGELVPGMYLTAVLFAMFRVRRNTFSHVLFISTASYVVVALAKAFLVPQSGSVTALALSVTAFLGVAAVLLVFSEHVHNLRAQLIDRNADLQAMLKRMSLAADQENPAKSFNRHFVMESLAREKGRADRTNLPFSVCIIEPDDFDGLLSKEGQIAVESIAQELCKRLRGAVRDMDGVSALPGKRLFGRISADVFVVILPSTNIDGAYTCAERIRSSISEQPFLESCRITVSAGIAECRRNEAVPDLLSRAEAELQVAHRSGGNCVAGMEYREALEAEISELPALHS